jgi:hypothetical protein
MPYGIGRSCFQDGDAPVDQVTPNCVLDAGQTQRFDRLINQFQKRFQSRRRQTPPYHPRGQKNQVRSRTPGAQSLPSPNPRSVAGIAAMVAQASAISRLSRRAGYRSASVVTFF